MSYNIQAMQTKYSINYVLFSIFMDSIFVAIALFVAVTLRPLMSIITFVKDIPPPYQIELPLYVVFPLLWILVFSILSIYDPKRTVDLRFEWINVTKGSIITGFFLSGILFLTYRETSRFLFISFWSLTYLFLLSWRFVSHKIILNLINRSSHKRNLLVLGNGPTAASLVDKIRNLPQTELAIKGFIDDNSLLSSLDKDPDHRFDELINVIRIESIHDVVIAFPLNETGVLNDLIGILHRLPVKVWAIPDYYKLALHKANIEELAGIPLIDLRAPAINEYQRMIKRAFDITFTLLSFPISLFLMLMVAIAVRLSSPGPIIFSQKRVGENGKLFLIYKFRSMVRNPEELSNIVESNADDEIIQKKTVDDPRISKIGKFLRRSSLDELPQLFNVIKGDMSLVGPRPELPWLVDHYETWQYQRFLVPQGMTGWWQVNGRSDKPMYLHTEDDIFYIQNYSIWLDIWILLKTFVVVVKGNGAF